MKSMDRRGVLQYAPTRNYWISILTVLLFITIHCSLFTAAFAAKWGGVDESVVEKYAEEHGRSAKDPIINTDQGDLLLFVFLLAGTVGGFAAGYSWRMLTEKTESKEQRPHLAERQKNI